MVIYHELYVRKDFVKEVTFVEAMAIDEQLARHVLSGEKYLNACFTVPIKEAEYEQLRALFHQTRGKHSGVEHP